jgi:nitrate reductase molybdenum cofactor assembly chaperone NarJ/NarW
MRTFKALSLLLSYPQEDLKAAVPVIRATLSEEGVLPPDHRAALAPLLDDLAARDLFDLQERYVFLFDRSRSLSLNLFEHVHGDSRARGQAMVDLLETYREGGYDLVGPELPDHLPVLLEFLSTRPLDEARDILRDAGAILAALGERLRRRDSIYAPVLGALVALAGEARDSDLIEALLAEADDDPDDLEALDAAWEETQVTFGPDPNAGCPAGRDILARMDIPPTAPRAGSAPAA